MGASVNILTGYLISRVNVQTLATVSAIITAVAAPLMATISVHESYWRAAFWAMLLSPVNPDGISALCVRPLLCNMNDWLIYILVLFTVSNLVISNAYPPDLQSLAGGVFNEVAQFGNSVGLAVTAAIAASVTEHSDLADRNEALLQGYRVAFWTIFAATSVVVFISFFGFRKGGLVGRKDD